MAKSRQVHILEVSGSTRATWAWVRGTSPSRVKNWAKKGRDGMSPLENQVNILVGALTTHGRIMQAGPPPENPDPAPTVWERLDEDDPV